jgi:hypothetical protein
LQLLQLPTTTDPNTTMTAATGGHYDADIRAASATVTTAIDTLATTTSSTTSHEYLFPQLMLRLLLYDDSPLLLLIAPLMLGIYCSHDWCD